MDAKTLLEERTSASTKADARRQRERSVEREILEAWPSSIPLHAVHAYPLYGASGTVALGDTYAPYGKPDERLTEAEMLERVAALPPLPRSMARDGSLSFPLTSWLDDQPEKASRIEQPIYPLRVDIEGLRQHAEQVEVKWYAQVGAHVVKIQARMKPGALPLQRSWRTRKRGGETWVEDVALRVTDDRFWLDQKARWWSSPDQPNHFTLYWLDPVDEQPTAEQVINYWRDAIHPTERHE